MDMKKRILVVDDVSDWRAQLEAILRRDYDVLTVADYEEAMDMIRSRAADLVIVDLRLSPTDENDRQGMDLLKELAAHRINAIVLTGYPEQPLQEEAEELYVFDFIDKGVVAKNFGYLKNVVDEAFKLLMGRKKKQEQSIRDAFTAQTVSFTEELATWPICKFRRNHEDES